MIIVCPSCDTSYRVALDEAGSSGRKVKCAKCAHVWVVTPAAAGDAGGLDNDAAAEDAAGPASDGEAAQDAGAALEQVDDPFEFAAALDSDVAAEDASGVAEWDTAMGQVLADAKAPRDEELFDAVKGALSDSDAGLSRPDGDPIFADKDQYSPVDDIESLAAMADEQAGAASGARAKGQPGSKLRAPSRGVTLGAAAAMLAVSMAAALLARHTVVGFLPSAAPLYAAIGIPVNVRGLEFRNVTFEHSFENGLPVLAIYGEVVNITDREVTVPEIRYGLNDKMRNEIYAWTGRVQAEKLQPEKAAPFVTRLQSPPPQAVHALVRFSRSGKGDGAS